MPTPFPIDAELTAITIAYQNASYIADAVLPRVPVGKESFKYQLYSLAEGFTLPETRVGRKGVPNEVEFSATEKTESTEDYGLDDVIPNSDIANAAAGKNPVSRAVPGLTDYILLAREKRTADLVFNAASYATPNKVTLTSTDQWSDFTGSDPVEDILAGLDACLVRPNIAVFGQEVWSVLRRHPVINKAVNHNNGDKGIASRQAIAELFELEEILIGASRLNTAKKGQTVTLGRVWGKHASFIHRNRNADTQGGLTFGFSPEFGSRVSGQMDEPKLGLRGAVRVRVGESLKELIVADRAGYFIQNAIA